MPETIQVGDRVEILLDARVWGNDGWFAGTVVRIDPYSRHRSFYWVQLSEEAAGRLGEGPKLISVLNPRNIRKA